MTKALATSTTLMTFFTLLGCNALVFAQESVTTIIGTMTVMENDSEPLAPPTHLKSAQTNVDQSGPAVLPPRVTMPEARPGERVTNPEHGILNPDTKLGGVVVNGPNPNDYGYLGPGDMRTHLWNGHSSELIENGITENKLMAMTVPEVQKWHNYFHGAQSHPDHHDDHDHAHAQVNTIIHQPEVLSTPSMIGGPAQGTIVYENSEYGNSVHPQFFNAQPEIIYEQGVIIEGSTSYDFAP